jgi:DNA-binding XRE family transcriptional regulator
MTITEVANYLRSHRRKSGLSQRELANIVGYVTQAPVSEHERSVTIPALLIALSYEVVFRVPLSELFPALYGTVEANIEEQLSMIESKLQQSTAKGRRAAYIARKLEWLWERRNPDTV